MNKPDNIYDKIQELLGDLKSTVSILEEQIDNDVQTEYFDFNRNIESGHQTEEIFNNREFIFSPDCSSEERKYLLCRLARIDDIEAYRTLERYARNPGNPLRDWACLALKENKLLLESKWLDESQVLISTGLGGKGLKLRYFIVFFTPAGIPFSGFQREMIRKELTYALGKANGALESLRFNRELCILLVCIPLQIPVNSLCDRIVYECNQVGRFLHDKYIVTNVRKFKITEIRKFLQAKGIGTGEQ
ncbi:MAG: hypothetical protein JXB19_03575 [Bacteroidales bacterium]|nr:hypothetical protein [Bacteroidales bacterium]